MAGRVLVDAFESPGPVERIPSWETVEGDCGSHTGPATADSLAEWAAHRQLVELGYAEAGDPQDEQRMAAVAAESRYYLARVHLSRGHTAQAIEILEPLTAELPKTKRYWRALMRAYYLGNHLDEFRAQLVARASEQGFNPAIEHVFWGWLHLAEKDGEAAARCFERAEALRPQARWILRLLAAAYALQGRREDAERVSDVLLEWDPQDEAALLLRGDVRRERGFWDGAVDDYLTLVTLRFTNPKAHFGLAQSLLPLGDPDRAEVAVRVATRQDPNLAEAHRLAVEIYGKHRPDADLVRHHLAELERLEARSA
jgi:tetratricopeptide (TPR) repeat protein